MNPGRALDALVAEKVIGWKYWRSKHGHWIIYAPDGRSLEPLFGNMPPAYNPTTGKKLPDPEWWEGCDDIHEYSTDIKAAWEVVEKIGTNFFTLSSGFTINHKWDASFSVKHGHPKALGDTAPHAICLAALMVAEYEVKE